MKKIFLLVLLFLVIIFFFRGETTVKTIAKNKPVLYQSSTEATITPSPIDDYEEIKDDEEFFDADFLDYSYVPELADFFPTPSPYEEISSKNTFSAVIPAASENNNFERNDLKELLDSSKDETSDSSNEAPFISDNISSGSGTSNSSASTSPTPEPSKLPDENLLPLVSGQARGYSMLYLMHPRARATVEKQIQAMVESNVAELFLAVLTDGTFARDFDYLADVIKRLSVRSKVKLVLYMTNGPSQRNYGRLPIDAGINAIDPETYNSLIKEDPITQFDYQSLIVSNLAVVNLNQRLGNSTIIIPMLEDNIDSEAFEVMFNLTRQVFGDGIEIRRNPCGCAYDDDARSTNFIEKHKLGDIPNLSTGDGFVLDGVGYSLDAGGINEVNGLLESTKFLEYFGLWRFERQGFMTKSVTQHPDDRTYEVPSEADIQKEIKLLRYGLTSVEP